MNNFKSITSKVFIIIIFIFISYGFAQNKYAIVLPEEYNKTQTYPLFIVFHGGNGNMKSMMKWWKSERLSEEFIVAYMEASTLDNPPNRWGWRNLTHERQNIKSYYDIIKKDYCIKENQVYVGGFSLGGKVSIDLALNQIIPVKGFISLNHGGGTTRFFTDENVKKIAKKNIKGVLVSGEKDYRYKKETAKIKAMFNSHGLQYLFIENEGIGHYAPDNFRKVLNTYLDFIVH